MHAKLLAFFDEHDAPTHCGTRHAHDQLSPLVRLVALNQKQIAEYKVLLTDAMLAPEHDPALNSLLEAMHQTLAAIERESTALGNAGREMAKAWVQLDRCMGEWRDGIAAYEERKAPSQEAPNEPSPR